VVCSIGKDSAKYRVDLFIREEQNRNCMTPQNHAGFTLVEFIVCLVVVAILIALALPTMPGSGLQSGRMTQTLSNMKQLHLATQQMALDGETTGNTNIGWPGDIGGTFSNWTARLAPEYLSTNDICKLLSAPGVVVPPGKIPVTNHTALLVYSVSTNSPGSAVFLSTANFTNTPTGGGILNASAKPYGDKGFIVFHVAGDGAILQPRQVGQTNIIGSFAPLCR
jgi:prepilin-type N-terminal cleavage/methylation domain-containing protein